jgi:hypothetical protein
MWAMALVGGSGVGAWVLEESEVGRARSLSPPSLSKIVLGEDGRRRPTD